MPKIKYNLYSINKHKIVAIKIIIPPPRYKTNSPDIPTIIGTINIGRLNTDRIIGGLIKFLSAIINVLSSG